MQNARKSLKSLEIGTKKDSILLEKLYRKVVGEDPDKTVEFQAVITMIVAAFDIHDNVLDGSKTKHGRPTVFGRYGQDVSLNSGRRVFGVRFHTAERKEYKAV